MENALTNPALAGLVVLGGVLLWAWTQHKARQADDRDREAEAERYFDAIWSEHNLKVTWAAETGIDSTFRGPLELPVDRSLRAQIEREIDGVRLDRRFVYERHPWVGDLDGCYARLYWRDGGPVGRRR